MNQEKKDQLDKLVRKSYNNMTGMVVVQGGNTIYESYFNGYRAYDAVHVASVTKSIVSALIGIAIKKDYIKSIEQKVLDFFPEYEVEAGEKTIQTVTIQDLLTMTAPYKYKREPYMAFFTSPNWVEFGLSQLGGKKSRGRFNYSAFVGTHILTGILTRAVGQSVYNFANKELFRPLDIQVKDSVVLDSKETHMDFCMKRKISGWGCDQQGINTAGFGLLLTARDMAKIGQLYLNHGQWQGKDILPTWWVKESIKQQSAWGKRAYGYLWWVLNEQDGIYGALGDGGNVIYVDEKKDMVVTMTSSFKPRAKDRLKFIEKYVIPMLGLNQN